MKELPLVSVVLTVWISISAAPALAYLMYDGDTHTLYLDQPIIQSEKSKLSPKIDSISVMDGADIGLFDSSSKFPHLRHVALTLGKGRFPSSERWLDLVKNQPNLFEFTQVVDSNTTPRDLSWYLTGLSKNYPDLTSLSICDTSPMTSNEVNFLKKFCTLRELDLSCPIDGSDAAMRSIPGGLDRLYPF